MVISENKYRVLLNTDKLSLGYKQKSNDIAFLQHNLNLNLFEEELVCLIGPNGCGKSTLIRTLSGLQSPLSGNVFVDGTNIAEIQISRRSDLMGVVLTDKGAVDNITVREIVSLGRYRSSNWLGMANIDDEARISDALNLVSLCGFDNRSYGSLSDGEKQRAFIAKVLASDSMIMLLDEPTAHLDIPNKVSILSLLRNLTRESGHSILVSTHELDLAMQLADQIWLMVPGDKLYTGTPEEILQSGLLDKVFGNEILSFNPGSGSFCVKTKNQMSVCIEGESSYLHMTIQAAKRLGFIMEKKDLADIRIKIKEKLWTIVNREDIFEFIEFTEVCRLLEKLSKQKKMPDEFKK